MSVKCNIEIPENIVKALGVRESEIATAIKKELAVYFFQKNLLSFGQARQLSGLSVWDFLDSLRERKVSLHYDISEYEEDLKTIHGLVND